MKTLKNHLILYDAECPMCNLYTRAFVKSGMLEHNGRSSYQETPVVSCPLVDRQRAVDEIALVDLETGKVDYGIVSLFKVIANSWPAFSGLFGNRFFIWLMSKCYAFVSYNRRVIVPGTQQGQYGLQPSFKLQYRLLYLAFTWICSAAILTIYAQHIHAIVPPGHAWREYAVCGGQLFFQALVIACIDGKKIWAYLGNMMTVSFAGSLLLLPAILLSHFLHIGALPLVIWFIVVVGLMFAEHLRRCGLLGLGLTPTISWAIYRLLLLILILNAGL